MLSFPTMEQPRFFPTGWGKTMAPGSLLSHTSMAFTYNLVQWINTHAKKRERVHCISFFLSVNPICSQVKNILLHSVNYPKVKYHVNKKVDRKPTNVNRTPQIKLNLTTHRKLPKYVRIYLGYIELN